MSNLEVTLAHFWQFASHWKNGDQSTLIFSYEAGKLQIDFNVSLNHPDNQRYKHIMKPSPSQLLRQERRHPCMTENIKADNAQASKNNINIEYISNRIP